MTGSNIGLTQSTTLNVKTSPLLTELKRTLAEKLSNLEKASFDSGVFRPASSNDHTTTTIA
jgi:hypothetical protein